MTCCNMYGLVTFTVSWVVGALFYQFISISISCYLINIIFGWVEIKLSDNIIRVSNISLKIISTIFLISGLHVFNFLYCAAETSCKYYSQNF